MRCTPRSSAPSAADKEAISGNQPPNPFETLEASAGGREGVVGALAWIDGIARQPAQLERHAREGRERFERIAVGLDDGCGRMVLEDPLEVDHVVRGLEHEGADRLAPHPLLPLQETQQAGVVAIGDVAVVLEMPAQVARHVHRSRRRRGLEGVLEQHQVFVGRECVEGMDGGEAWIVGQHCGDLGLCVGDAGIARALRLGEVPAGKGRGMAAFPPGERARADLENSDTVFAPSGRSPLDRPTGPSNSHLKRV